MKLSELLDVLDAEAQVNVVLEDIDGRGEHIVCHNSNYKNVKPYLDREVKGVKSDSYATKITIRDTRYSDQDKLEMLDKVLKEEKNGTV